MLYEKSIKFIDAPVSGGVSGAEKQLNYYGRRKKYI